MKQASQLNPAVKIRNLEKCYQDDFENTKNQALQKLHSILKLSAENPEITHLTESSFKRNERKLVINVTIAGPCIAFEEILSPKIEEPDFDHTRLNTENQSSWYLIQRNPACKDLINRPGASLYRHSTGIFHFLRLPVYLILSLSA